MTVSCRTYPPLLCAIFLTVSRALGQEVAASDPAVAAAAAAESVALPAKRAWSTWGGISAGAGYRDNVLLSNAGEQRSGFVRGSVDATAWNMGHERVDYWAAVRAMGTRYFSAKYKSGALEKTANPDSQALLLSEVNFRPVEAFKFTLGGTAAYSHLTYDISDTPLLPEETEVERMTGALSPKVRWSFLPSWWVEVQGGARRDAYPGGYNDRTTREGSFRLAWHRGRRLEVSVAGQEARRRYDERRAYNSRGDPLDDTLLHIVEREGELRLKATLDAAEHWQTVTRVSVSHYVDNGSGFLEYRERKVKQDLDWSSGAWTVEFEAAARRLEFVRQTVGIGVTPPPRIRDAFYLRLMVERKLTPRWSAYAEYTWDRNRFNDPLSTYSLNEGLLGLRWNWEK